MKKYNWKKMELHARNYDGTCSCCGGRCTEDDVSDMFYAAENESTDAYLWWRNFPSESASYRRYYYLRKRLDRCYNYRFLD